MSISKFRLRRRSRCRRAREAFTADIEVVERIGAKSVRSSRRFSSVSLSFSPDLFFRRTVPSPFDFGGLDCENQVVVVLTVEEWLEAVPTGETLVDEDISHGASWVLRGIWNRPTILFFER